MTQRVDKDSLPLDQPRRTPGHPTKSHIVKTKVDGKEKIIRFGEQGASTAGKPKAGESERMKAKRASFKARHAKNIAKGKSSPAYWADKVKWAEGGSVSLMKPPPPGGIIARLTEQIRRGQAAQEQEQLQLESLRKMYERQRLGSARRSPLTDMRSTASTTPPSSSPPAEAVETPAGAGTDSVQVVRPVALPGGDNPFQAEAIKLAEKYNLPVNVFLSLVNQESRFNPEARSPKGAMGLTQLMPATAKELGVDPTDPLQNLEGGARYLRQQIDRFGSLPLALAAYNAGPGNVRKHGGIPPFKETQQYVAKVLRGAGEEGFAGGGIVSKLARRAAKSVDDVAEQKMLQGFYRGYAGDYDALRAGEEAGTVFVSPQKPVGEYYGRKRAAQTGEEPHLEMLLADPFGGKQYGHAVPMGPMNRSGVGQTMAREFKPEEIEEIVKLFNEGGAVKGYAEGGEVEAEMKPTPRNRLTGYAADKLRSLSDLASEYSIPESIPLLGGTTVAEMLGLPGAAREVERWSYGNYPMRVNPYAGRTSSFVPEVKPGRQSDLGDTLLLGSDLTGVGSLAGKYGLKAGKAGLRTAGEELNRAVMSGEGVLSPLISQAAQPAYVIKPKGGNWLSGSLDAAVAPLKQDVRYLANRSEAEALLLPENQAALAANKWLDTKLKKYIQNEMGTPEDPLRALADKDMLHYAPRDRYGPELEYLYDLREAAGMPTESIAATDLGAAWEELADTAISSSPASTYQNFGSSNLNLDWVNKLDPDTPFYRTEPEISDLGFNHLVDELKNAMRPDSDLPDRLRIDPKKLDKMTVPQVVERVSQINAWRAEQMAAANAEKAMNPATQLVKEYPEQGYKWVELRQPEKPEGWTAPERYEIKQPTPSSGTLAIFDKEKGQYVTTGLQSEQQAIDHLYKMNTKQALEDALKYEGDVMGHCVGGYCPDVISGETRIYSLRDSKGQPHVTIEVAPVRIQDFTANTPDPANPARTLRDRINAERKGDGDFESYGLDLLQRLEIGPPMKIVQIKGKQNRAPKEEYLPFVQDFVKGGQWSDVGDIRNAGLRATRDAFNDNELKMIREAGIEVPTYATQEEIKSIGNTVWPGMWGDVNYAAGGLVSAYNPEAVDAMVNQILEGAYV